MFVFAHEFNILLPPHRPVCKLHLVETVLLASEMFLHPDAPGTVPQRKRHVVVIPPTDNLEVLRGDPLSELQYVLLMPAVVGVIVDNIVPIAMVVHVLVVIVTTLEGIVPSSTNKYVVSILTIQLVVPGVTVQISRTFPS